MKTYRSLSNDVTAAILVYKYVDATGCIYLLYISFILSELVTDKRVSFQGISHHWWKLQVIYSRPLITYDTDEGNEIKVKRAKRAEL